jgi:replicative DNA helicase
MALVHLRNNSTVFEELEVSIVDFTVANAILLAMRSGASKTDICDRQIHN